MIEFLPDNCPGASTSIPSTRLHATQKCDDWSIRGLLSHSQGGESDGYGGKHEGLYLTSWELDLRCSTRNSQGTTGGHLLLLCCDLFPPVLTYSARSGGNGIYRGVPFCYFWISLCLYLNFDPISGLSVSLIFRQHSLSAALRFGRGDSFSRVD
eukprot:scaffold78037_cov54-Attheya_sp.AAC.1